MTKPGKANHKVCNLPGDARVRLAGEITEDDDAEYSHSRALPARGTAAAAAEDKGTARNSGTSLRDRPASESTGRGARRGSGGGEQVGSPPGHPPPREP